MKQKRVLLLVEASREYGRGVLRGVFSYNKLHGRKWMFEWQEPLYNRPFKQAQRRVEALADLDGIIMRDQPNNEPFLKKNVPIVLIDHLKISHDDIPQVMTDDEEIAASAFKHFLDRGLTNFAFMGYDAVYWSENRKNSFCEIAKKSGYHCDNFRQPKQKKQRQWGKEQVKVSQWLKSLPKPVGLFCCNDDRGRQAIEACYFAGVSVPDEVAVVGVDNDEFVCDSTLPALSSVAINVDAAGYHAAEILDQKMKDNKKPAQRILIGPSHVVPRQSSEILSISDPIVLEAVRFVLNNSNSLITVDEVAAHLAVSRRSVHTRFKRVLGCGVHSYIKKIKIDKIKSLLIETDWKIYQIAECLGFSSTEHIAAYFRSQVGVNPYKYRKQHKGLA